MTIHKWKFLVGGLLLATLVVVLWSRGITQLVTGRAEGFVPVSHRLPNDQMFVLLSIENKDVQLPQATLERIGDQVVNAFADKHLPMAPTAGDLDAWIAAHLFYWLADRDYNALVKALDPSEMEVAIAKLKALAASPLFMFAHPSPQQDPLGLFGVLKEISKDSSPYFVTEHGDLVAKDGRHMLLQLTATEEEEVTVRIKEALRTESVTWMIVRGAYGQTTIYQWIVAQGWKIFVATVSLILLGFSLVLRDAKLVLRIVSQAFVAVVVAAVVVVPIDIFSLAMLSIFFAGACLIAMLHVARVISISRLAAVFSVPMACLWLFDYPLLRVWGWGWMAGVGGLWLLLWGSGNRISLTDELPAIVRRNCLRRPQLALGCLFATIITILSVFVFSPQGPLERSPLSNHGEVDMMSRFFFSPVNQAWFKICGETTEETLKNAIAATDLVTEKSNIQVPAVENPVAWIFSDDKTRRLRTKIDRLDLATKFNKLTKVLQSEGFNPRAFAEFLTLPQSAPNVHTVLQGPLSQWIHANIYRDGMQFCFNHKVRLNEPLRGQDKHDLLVKSIDIKGPHVANGEAHTMLSWQVVTVLIGTALLVSGLLFLPDSGSMAISSTCCCLVANSAALLVLFALEFTAGPWMLFIVVLNSCLVSSLLRFVWVRPIDEIFLPRFVACCLGIIGTAILCIMFDCHVWLQMGLSLGVSTLVAVTMTLFVARISHRSRVTKSLEGIRS